VTGGRSDDRRPDAGRRLELRGTGGIRLAASAWGDPAAAPVVFLPGGGQTRHSWAAAGRALAAAGFLAVSVDLRGHGDSEWAPDGDYRHATLAADLVALAGVLCSSGTSARPPAVVGASLGGVAALLAAGEMGLPVGALVLVDIVPRSERAGVRRVVSFLAGNEDGFASLEEAAAAVAAYKPDRPVDAGRLRHNLRVGEDGRWRWHWDPRLVSHQGRHSRDIPERMAAASAGITVPTLLVRGRKSDMVSDEGVAEFQALIPQAEFVDIADAAHMVTGDHNDAFAGAVIEFLTRVASVAGHPGDGGVSPR
jgi:pimeloyl-ACP methyl ester carboxylesterase